MKFIFQGVKELSLGEKRIKDIFNQTSGRTNLHTITFQQGKIISCGCTEPSSSQAEALL